MYCNNIFLGIMKSKMVNLYGGITDLHKISKKLGTFGIWKMIDGLQGRTIFDRLVRKMNWIAEFECIKKAIPK